MDKKSLKIAVLVKSFILSGGSERYTVEVTTRLRDRGHEVHLFARRAEAGLAQGMTMHEVPDRMKFSSAANSYSFAREAARLLKGKSFDVVHSHERGFCQDVMTIHTFTYKGSLFKYSFIRRMDQKYLSYRSWIYHWLERRQMDSPWLAAVSGVIRDDIARYYDRTENVAVIPPGVDTTWFHPDVIAGQREASRRLVNATADDVVVLFIGSEYRRKGLDLLIPALSGNMRLVVVGHGERHSHYHELARKHGVFDKVEFVGFVGDDIRKYYAAADVVVLPSHTEAFGMTVLEGMACGLPVIVNRKAGASAVVDHARSGFIFDDSNGLRESLRMLLDPGRRSVMGREARGKAETLTWDSETDKYEEIYYAVAEKKRRVA